MPGAESSSVLVAVRIRPSNAREDATECTVALNGDQKTLVISDPAGSSSRHSFTFDKVFCSMVMPSQQQQQQLCSPSSFSSPPPSTASVASSPNSNASSPLRSPPLVPVDDQEAVYNYVGPRLCEHAMGGYNSCLFAYGQTGSGKTYTMIGPQNELGIETGVDADCGVVPRLCADLFERMEHERSQDPTITHRVECSFVEIYCEKVRDLLTPGSSALRVRQHPSRGPYVEGLPSPCVGSAEAVMKLLTLGMKERATAETRMNEHSSRSHAILQLNVTRVMIVNEADTVITKTRCSKVSLVDLAGSERLTQSGATGDRLEEAKNINLSLHTLGRVIHTLAERGTTSSGSAAGKSAMPAYRDSALTWLLSDSLGGNSKTMMIATIAASNSCYSQSLNTLRFAGLTQRVVNVAVVNEDSHFQKLISELREQIVRLTLKVETGKSHEEQATKSERLQQMNDDLRSQNRQLESKLAAQETNSAREHLQRVSGLEAELAAAKNDKLQQRSEFANIISSLKEELAQKRGDVLSLQTSLAGKERELQEWITKYHELLSRASGSGSPPPCPSSAELSSPQNPVADSSTRLFFGDSRAKLEAKIQQTRNQLAEANAKNSELTASLHTEENRRKQAEHQRADLAQRLASAMSEQGNLQSTIQRLQNESLQLKSQVEELQHAFQQSESRLQAAAKKESDDAARQVLEDQLQNAQEQLKALRQANSKLRHEVLLQTKAQEKSHAVQLSLRADVCELEQLLLEETETSERHFLDLHGDSTYAGIMRQHSRALKGLFDMSAHRREQVHQLEREEASRRLYIEREERHSSADSLFTNRSLPAIGEANAALHQQLELRDETISHMREQLSASEASLADACGKMLNLHERLNVALHELDEARSREANLMSTLEQGAADRESLVHTICDARSNVANLEEQLASLRQQCAQLEVAAQAAEEDAKRRVELEEEAFDLRQQLAASMEQCSSKQQQLDRANAALKALNQGASASEVERSLLECSNATIATNYETVLVNMRQELRTALEENAQLRQQQQVAQSSQQQRHRDEVRRLQDQLHELQVELQRQRSQTTDAETRLEMVQNQFQCDLAEKDFAMQLQRREMVALEKAVQQLREDFGTVRSQVVQASVARNLGSPLPRRHAKSRSLGGEMTPISNSSNSRPGTGCRPPSGILAATPNHGEDSLLQEWSPGQFNRQIERVRQEKDVTDSQRLDAARLYEELLAHVDQRSRALQHIAHQLELLEAGPTQNFSSGGEEGALDDEDGDRNPIAIKLNVESEDAFSMSFSPK